MKLYRYIEVSLYRDSRYNDIAIKSPKISLYRGKIKMYFFTAYYLIKLVMSIKQFTNVAFQARSNDTAMSLNNLQSIRRFQGYTTVSVV